MRRFNRTFITMLRRAVASRPYDWEPLRPTVLQAYWSTVSESMGFTPHRLHLVARCVYRSTSVRRFPSHRPVFVRWQILSQRTSSILTESRVRSPVFSINAERVASTNESWETLRLRCARPLHLANAPRWRIIEARATILWSLRGCPGPWSCSHAARARNTACIHR